MSRGLTKYYWLYTMIIFTIITGIFYILFGGPLFTGKFYIGSFLVMLLLGFIIGLLSAYILSPLILWRAFRNLDDFRISGIIQQISEAAGLKKIPKLMVFNTPEYNAFTYESLTGAKIVLTSGILNGFYSGNVSEEELRSIIAHEVGHIKHGDTLRRWIVQSWISVFYSIGSFLFFAGLFIAGIGVFEAVLDRNAANVLIGMILSVLGSIMMIISKVIGLIALHHDRFNEYLADEFGASLTSGRSMISALEKVNEANLKLINRNIPYSPYPDSWQVKPMRTSWIDRIFSDHPPLDKRIEKLKNF